MKEPTYDAILELYLANYGTTENWVRSYGGEVVFKESDIDQKLDKSSKLKITFSRDIKFPRELVAEWDPAYREEVPTL